jgi:hypothetical protein
MQAPKKAKRVNKKAVILFHTMIYCAKWGFFLRCGQALRKKKSLHKKALIQ